MLQRANSELPGHSPCGREGTSLTHVLVDPLTHPGHTIRSASLPRWLPLQLHYPTHPGDLCDRTHNPRLHPRTEVPSHISNLPLLHPSHAPAIHPNARTRPGNGCE